MDAFQTPGAFSWNELMTSDPEAALAFYTALLGWTTKKMAMPDGAYHVLNVGDTAVGGVMALPPQAQAGGMPPCWGSYVTVADVDATARRAAELGGKVVHGPQDIPGVGRMAVIVDPQGASINVIAYAPPAG
ncbi:MAG: VOC family protein [Burkholderiaceae bacterium]|jgi:predicted enzyme related to lactoylglutathione lyase|nr:VOC family protein [Burkholderiaceae bacterium]